MYAGTCSLPISVKNYSNVHIYFDYLVIVNVNFYAVSQYD